MTRARIAAAIAALITALLLQATLIGAVSVPLPVSLPAVLVAAVALVDGPGAGIAFGFATGLIADLGSQHPAGVQALCWLGVGLGCGLLRSPYSRLLRDVVVAAAAAGTAAGVATVVLRILDADGGASLDIAVRRGLAAVLVDGVLALAIVPLARLFLRSTSLRAPRPVLLLGQDS